MLVHADPERCVVPPYVGHHGLVGLYLDGALDWDAIADLVGDGYRMTALKRLVAMLDQR
jgi:hypothetical protein